MEAEVQALRSGGMDWLLISVIRRSNGLEIWAKADPRVEQFTSSLGDGITDDLEAYGRNWFGTNPEKPIKVYRSNKSVKSGVYTIEAVAGAFTIEPPVNLSFLRFQGLSEGIGFVVSTPFRTDTIKEIYRNILVASRTFIRDYISPVEVILRISSQEV